MKKLLAVLLAIGILLSFALAEAELVPGGETVITDLNWDEFAPFLEGSGLTGQFYTFDEAGLKMWIPDELKPAELTDEEKANSFIGYYTTGDQSATVSVMYADVGGMSLEDYQAYLSSEEGVSEVGTGTVNGMPCVFYNTDAQGSASVALFPQDGFAFEVTCLPVSEEGAAIVWAIVISSIQAA